MGCLPGHSRCKGLGINVAGNVRQSLGRASGSRPRSRVKRHQHKGRPAIRGCEIDSRSPARLPEQLRSTGNDDNKEN